MNNLRLVFNNSDYQNLYDSLFNELKLNKETYDFKRDNNQIEFVLFDDNEFIGIAYVNLKLSMALLDDGGNINIIILPNKRNKGYGKAFLSLLLNYLKDECHLKKVLFTIPLDNKSAIKIVEDNNGVLVRESEDKNLNKTIRYYWITFSNNIIETDRLILREMRMDDFSSLAKVISDPINMKHYPKPYDDNGVNRWINWCIASYARRGFGLWAITLKENDEFIGDCGLSMQNIDGNEVPEIGYHLRLDKHKLGYAIEAASFVRDYIFNTYDFDRLYSYMNATNVDSYSLAIKNGMSFMKEYNEDGFSHKVYSISRDEWMKIKK